MVMTTEADKAIIYKAHIIIHSGNIANPDVVHRSMFWKRQRLFKYTPAEGHAATQIAILNKKIIHPTSTSTIEFVK